MIVAALARLGRRMGLSFVGDTTSEHVLELARSVRPEVIILDVHQRIDGRDLLARLKQDPETRDLKVIMFSAVEDQFMRLNCLELGADDYAVKPVDPSFMLKVARLAGALAPQVAADPLH